MIQAVITAAMSLAAVALGAWLAGRAQDRGWRRDHAQRWRDIRLERYIAFLDAVREYVVYVQQPEATITVIKRPQHPHNLMPRLEEDGAAYTQRLDSTKTAVRLVTSNDKVFQASRDLVDAARQLAVGIATDAPGMAVSEHFQQVWKAERSVIRHTRTELGLTDNQALRRWLMP